MKKASNNRGIALSGCVLALLGLLLAGCATVNPEEMGRTRKFAFPFLLNYAVENNTTFAWSDTWLMGNPDTYDQRLAGPFCALAASTYGFNTGMDQRSFAEMGFDPAKLYRRYGRDLNYRDPKYGRDQSGFTLAHRTALLGGTCWDVLVVAVRGTFGRDEWVSNMNLANTWGRQEKLDITKLPALHEGFAKAADAIYRTFEDYARTNRCDLSMTKVIVVGHSRGGAVANVVAALLDDACGDKASFFGALRHENIFAYTFAAPNTILDDRRNGTAAKYRNIFNVLNPEDAVPLVPLVAWNCRRFGRDLILEDYNSMGVWGGAVTDVAYNRMKTAFNEMTGYHYWHMPFGTLSTDLLPSGLQYAAPTITDLYSMPPEQRESGNMTCVQSVLESLMFRYMEPADDRSNNISLGGDTCTFTEMYEKADTGLKGGKKPRFIVPDGIDFSLTPGVWDIPWRVACMHATQTYLAWMKAGEQSGPENIYQNWEEINGEK